MKTLTQRMIERCEWLKAEYAKIIQANDGRPEETELEFDMWRRLNTILCYLEERNERK